MFYQIIGVFICAIGAYWLLLSFRYFNMIMIIIGAAICYGGYKCYKYGEQVSDEIKQNNSLFEKNKMTVDNIMKEKEVIDAADMLAAVYLEQENDGEIEKINDIQVEKEKVWKCRYCGYVHGGKYKLNKCPSCQRIDALFEENTPENNFTNSNSDVDDWFV